MFIYDEDRTDEERAEEARSNREALSELLQGVSEETLREILKALSTVTVRQTEYFSTLPERDQEPAFRSLSGFNLDSDDLSEILGRHCGFLFELSNIEDSAEILAFDLGHGFSMAAVGQRYTFRRTEEGLRLDSVVMNWIS